MIEILICEDNKKEVEFIVKVISDYILIENLDMELALTTSNPQEMLAHVNRNAGPFLCFVDIELGDIEDNGVTLSSKIKTINPEALIVFVTSNGDYMKLTFEYKIGAIGYIMKGNPNEQKEKVIEYLNYAHQHFSNSTVNEKRFAFNVKDNTMIEVNDDIISFELKNKNVKKVTIYTKYRSYDFFGTLAKAEEMDESFFRVHRSVVINTNNISWIDEKNHKIYMVNGDVCSASTRGIKALKARLY